MHNNIVVYVERERETQLHAPLRHQRISILLGYQQHRSNAARVAPHRHRRDAKDPPRHDHQRTERPAAGTHITHSPRRRKILAGYGCYNGGRVDAPPLRIE